MRPLETLLTAANIAALLGVLATRPRPLRWLRHAPPVALAAAIAQVVFEGARWQMVPAYVLSGLLFVVWLQRVLVTPHDDRPRPGVRTAARALGAATAVLLLVLSVALPEVLPVADFPQPTGPFDVGTVTYHWVDQDRPETFTDDPADRREVMTQIWYPADAEASAPRAPYIEHADEVTEAVAHVLDVPSFALGHVSAFTTNAVQGAPVAGDGRHPVVILLSGRGGFRQAQTFQIEELASHGYVVASIDHPYAFARVVFPDGRRIDYDPRMDDRTFMDGMLPHLAQDVSFVLDQLAGVDRADPAGILTGRLDLRRSGLAGHSLGAVVGSLACHREPRLRACLLEDAFMPADVVRDGLRQPAMWITRDAATMREERRASGGWDEAEIAEHITTMRSVFEHLPDHGYYVEVDGIFHLDMTDAPLLSPAAHQLGLGGPMGPERAHGIVNAYTLAFFDRHLRDLPAPLLDGPSRFREVTVEARHPDAG